MTARRGILDAGPWIALIDRRDAAHEWAIATLAQYRDPLITAEPVVTEACFLAQRLDDGPRRIHNMIRKGFARIDFSLSAELDAVDALVQRYANVPMSLADSCLVRMSELYPKAKVITVDSDFRIYRRHGREAIPLVMPPGLSKRR